MKSKRKWWFLLITLILSLNMGADCWGGDDDDDDDNNQDPPITDYYSLTTSVVPEQTGIITPSSGEYPKNQEITLTAQPIEGWEFVNWEGTDGNTVNPTTVVMNEHKNVIAHFKSIDPSITYDLTVTINGSGTVNPNGGTFTQSQVITLTATPDPGWQFDHWIGTNNNNINPTSVTMNNHKTVTAVFTEIPVPTYDLTTSVSPARKGSISPVSGIYNEGQVITLTATPIAGWQFDHWISTTNNDKNPTTVIMNTDKHVTAVFVENPVTTYELSSLVYPDRTGSFTPNSGTFNAGQTITITATPGQNWQFDYWEGTNDTFSNPTEVTMNSDKVVIAHFKSAITYRVPWYNFSPFPTEAEPTFISEDDLRDRVLMIAPYCLGLRSFRCRQGMEKLPEIAEEYGLKVAMGAEMDGDHLENLDKLDELIALANTGLVDFIIPGNELLERGDVSAATIINYINTAKAGAPGVPVTVSDTYYQLWLNQNVIDACDIVFYNVYPYWEGVKIDYAVSYVREVHALMESLSGGKPVYCAEIGWPSAGPTNDDAIPSIENSAFHFLNVASWARAEGITYFYFEFIDEPWKWIYEGIVGKYWGNWDKNWVMKPGVIDVFNGESTIDNWTGTAFKPGGDGTPSIEITSYPPYGDGDSFLKGIAQHIYPADYHAAVYVSTIWGWYTKPTNLEPITKIHASGDWRCNVNTHEDDKDNVQRFIIFLLPITYTPPFMNGGALPQELYDNALDYHEVIR